MCEHKNDATEDHKKKGIGKNSIHIISQLFILKTVDYDDCWEAIRAEFHPISLMFCLD